MHNQKDFYALAPRLPSSDEQTRFGCLAGSVEQTQPVNSSASIGDGSLKLRGLLHQSRELLRQRQLKRTVTNAQIAYDFALRGGEAPDVAFRAQLVLARAQALQGYYAFDNQLVEIAQRRLERLAAESPLVAQPELAIELQLVRGENALLLHDTAFAKTHFAGLIARTPPSALLLLRAQLGLAETCLRRAETADLAQVLAEAEANWTAEPQELSPEHGRLLYLQARLAALQGNLPLAVHAASEALVLAKTIQHPELVAKAKLALGSYSRSRGNFEIALRFLYEALDVAEQYESGPETLAIQLQIGQAFEELRNDAEAAKHFNIVAEQAARYKLDTPAYAANLALAQAAQRERRSDDAQTQLALALQAAQGSLSGAEQASVLAELADLQLQRGALGLAQYYVEAALQRLGVEGGLCELPAAISGRLPAKLFLVGAHLAFVGKDMEKCLRCGERALRIGLLEHRPEVAVAAERLRGLAFEALGDVAAALSAERHATQLLEEGQSRHQDRQLADLDMRAALRQREREIERLTRESGLKSALLAKNDEVERANADLLQANEDLRQFAFVASHDLKEPLRQIGSYVSLLKRQYANAFDADGQTYLGFVTDGVARLNRLFDSLMHYTSVARIERENNDVDLNRLLEGICLEQSAVIAAKGARIQYATLPTVQTGGKLIRHVMSALIDNALKFVPADRAPEVQIAVQAEGDAYCIRVVDNGIGILQEYQDKVFQLFQMLHAKNEYVGTGVGLAVAQKTVQRLGGRIWFEDRADGQAGVSFCFTLPMHVERKLVGLEEQERETSFSEQAA